MCSKNASLIQRRAEGIEALLEAVKPRNKDAPLRFQIQFSIWGKDDPRQRVVPEASCAEGKNCANSRSREKSQCNREEVTQACVTLDTSCGCSWQKSVGAASPPRRLRKGLRFTSAHTRTLSRWTRVALHPFEVNGPSLQTRFGTRVVTIVTHAV